MSKASSTIIEVMGHELETDNVIYEVGPKFDADAPDGYKNLKTSKLLNKSAVNTHTVGFDRTIKLWDTGLYAESPMYSHLSVKVRERLGEKIRELITIPFENKYGKDPETGKSRLDPTNEKSVFWNREDSSSFKIELYNGRIFNTKEPEQLLELFVAIASGILAPKEMEDDPDYMTAQFAVENKEKVRTAKQRDDMLDVKTLGAFANLLGSEKKLNLILNYVGVKTSSTFNESLITSQFKLWIEHREHSHQNKNLFLEAVDKSKDKNGYKELNYYKVLQDLYRKGTIKKEFENFLLDGEVLGTGNFKNCASNVVKDKGLETKVIDYMK